MGPPLSEIGNSVCVGGFICRGAAFSGLPILTPIDVENLLLILIFDECTSGFRETFGGIHKKHKISTYQKMKSSLKFCVIAAGEFDMYVAEPRAYEWDIAAGHAILMHSGGTITDFNGNEILYGKKGLKNPSIILKSKNIL